MLLFVDTLLLLLGHGLVVLHLDLQFGNQVVLSIQLFLLTSDHPFELLYFVVVDHFGTYRRGTGVELVEQVFLLLGGPEQSLFVLTGLLAEQLQFFL